MIIALICMGVLLLLALMVIAAIVFKYRKDKEKWIRNSEESFNRGKETAADVVRMTMDRIQEDRKRFSEMDPRDLQVEMILALCGHGRRMDRIEEKIQSVVNLKVYMMEINKQLKTLTDNAICLQKMVDEVGTAASSVKTTVQETNGSVRQLNVSMGAVGDISVKMERLMDKVRNQLISLEEIGENASDIESKLNQMFDSYADGPMEKLNDIHSMVQDVKSGVDNIRSTVSDSLDQYGYDNVYSRLGDLKWSLSNMDSQLSDIKSAVDCVQSDVSSLSQ